jgi:hypothetical protein
MKNVLCGTPPTEKEYYIPVNQATVQCDWFYRLCQKSSVLAKFYEVLRIHDILVWIWIRIRGSILLTNRSGSRPPIFFIDLQEAN